MSRRRKVELGEGGHINEQKEERRIKRRRKEE
jgi:hypothetical protein